VTDIASALVEFLTNARFPVLIAVDGFLAKKHLGLKSKRRRRRRKSLQRGGTLSPAERAEQAMVKAQKEAVQEAEAAAQGLREAEIQQKKMQRDALYDQSATYWDQLSTKDKKKMELT